MLTYYCLYRSVALTEPKSSASASIFITSRHNNMKFGITGYLHQEDGYYVQYIEGPAASIAGLISVIEADHRHKDMNILRHATRTDRMFSGWTMAFTDTETRAFRDSMPQFDCTTTIGTASTDDLMDFVSDYGVKAVAAVA